MTGEDLANPAVVRRLLAEHRLRVSKGLGQNFLCSRPALEAVVAAAAAEEADVLEIGPGLGTLTRELAARARSVVAVEVATRLEPVLRRTLAEFANVRIVIHDFLRVPAAELGPGPFVVAANLPYTITTPAIFRFLDNEIAWTRLVFMVQAELAERMASSPGSKTYGALSIAAQALARVEIVRRVSSSCFWPRPKVESAVVRLTPRGTERPEILRRLLAIAFSSRRKLLKNALEKYPGGREAISALGLAPDKRPEQVAVEEWLALARHLSAE